MKIAGILCKDVITRNNILKTLQKKGIEAVAVHSSSRFNPDIFDFFFVDLNSEAAFLLLTSNQERCIVFDSSGDLLSLQKAKGLGCPRVYKNGAFFKKILPNFSWNEIQWV